MELQMGEKTEWNKKASKMKQREKNWVRINVLFSYCCCSHQDVNVLRRTHLTYMCTMLCCCVFIFNSFFRLLSLSRSCHHRCRNWLVVYVKNFMPIFWVKSMHLPSQSLSIVSNDCSHSMPLSTEILFRFVAFSLNMIGNAYASIGNLYFYTREEEKKIKKRTHTHTHTLHTHSLSLSSFTLTSVHIWNSFLMFFFILQFFLCVSIWFSS